MLVCVGVLCIYPSAAAAVLLIGGKVAADVAANSSLPKSGVVVSRVYVQA
eukprot:COSAG06_NODE_41533_length_390_cov_0.917526_1_plen_49_part_01